MDVHEVHKRMKAYGMAVFWDPPTETLHAQCPCCQHYLRKGHMEDEPMGLEVKPYKGGAWFSCKWGCDKHRVRTLLGYGGRPGENHIDQSARCTATAECFDQPGQGRSPWVLPDGYVESLLEP